MKETTITITRKILAEIGFGLRRLDGAFPSAQPSAARSGGHARPKRCQGAALQSARHLGVMLILAALAQLSTINFQLSAAVFTNNLTITETNTSFDGQDIVIDGATVTIDGPHGFNSLLLTNGAVLTHSPCTASETHKLDLVVSNEVIISTGSRIDVTATGYLPGRTTGNTTLGGSGNFSAGSYGGLGSGGSPNVVYGDYARPADWGSGGSQGSGGGQVQLRAERLVLDGEIAADGQSCGCFNFGAGSGGGVIIEVNSVTGTGGIHASGGFGRNDISGGGGGRVAVYYRNLAGFDLSQVTARGGNVNGGAGTILRPIH